MLSTDTLHSTHTQYTMHEQLGLLTVDISRQSYQSSDVQYDFVQDFCTGQAGGTINSIGSYYILRGASPTKISRASEVTAKSTEWPKPTHPTLHSPFNYVSESLSFQVTTVSPSHPISPALEELPSHHTTPHPWHTFFLH